MFNLSPKQWESLSKLHYWLDDYIGCDMDGNPLTSMEYIDDYLPLLPL